MAHPGLEGYTRDLIRDEISGEFDTQEHALFSADEMRRRGGFKRGKVTWRRPMSGEYTFEPK
jgi:hypothetical protein